MEKNDIPVKGWKENKARKGAVDDSILVLLDKCMGDETVVSKEGAAEESGDEKKTVSIRCRRHRRRFEVPESWLKVSDWLCPKCYKKLTSKERERYAPKKTATQLDRSGTGVSPQVEKAEVKLEEVPRKSTTKGLKKVEMDCIYCGKKVVVSAVEYFTDHFYCPQCAGRLNDWTKRAFKESFAKTQQRRYEAIEAQYVRLEKFKPVEVDKNERDRVSSTTSIKGIGIGNGDGLDGNEGNGDSGVSNPKLAALLPRYRIVCKKCGKTVPCHGSWATNSKVLCPSCYAEMKKPEIERFHILYPEKTAEFFEIELPKVPATAKTIPDWVIDLPNSTLNDYAESNGVCSTSFITQASPKQLMQAVKRGKLSKARFRIEMNRRKNTAFFNSLPDAGISIF